MRTVTKPRKPKRYISKEQGSAIEAARRTILISVFKWHSSFYATYGREKDKQWYHDVIRLYGNGDKETILRFDRWTSGPNWYCKIIGSDTILRFRCFAICAEARTSKGKGLWPEEIFCCSSSSSSCCSRRRRTPGGFFFLISKKNPGLLLPS